jgi:glutathione synthase/RimK-type ligase-like ATP-grasp enzyme
LKQAFTGVDLSPLAQQWIERAKRNHDPNALMDLAIVLELQGKRELALAIQGDALRQGQRFPIASTATDPMLRLLVIKAPGDLSTNTPLECLLENTNIAMELLYVGPGLPLPEVLPEYDLLFVAVAESNDNRPILEYLQQRLASWPRPYLNAPCEILKVERDRACALLGPIPGISMPPTQRADRETLFQLGRGEIQLNMLLPAAEFPMIVRPLDSHAGRGLIKAESAAELLAYLEERSDSEFYISQFIDYSSTDNLFRKYRVVMMRGVPFLCHMGISNHWMVHYPYEEMIANPARREEEGLAMANFDQAFARRHQAALAAVSEQIQLEYIGLDCAETKNGDLLIFEVASAMLVHAMDNPDLFPYKGAQMRKVSSAFQAMLLSAAAPGDSVEAVRLV